MAKLTSLHKDESAITAKKNAAERRREKARIIESKFKGGDEPELDPFHYQLSLIKALNWYNLNAELKDIRGYLNEYLLSTDRKKLITKLNKCTDYEIHSLGLLCRLKTRNQGLSSEHETLIETKIEELSSTIDIPDVIIKSEPKVKVDNSDEVALDYCDVVEGAIDEFVKKKKSDFSMSDYLKGQEIKGNIAKKIGDYYSSMLKELNETLNDNDLMEGYSNFTKPQFKKFIIFIESIVSACNQQIVSAKVRKPRTIKPKSPTKIVANVKYLKEYATLNLKSVKPESMVDSTEIWIYNTKYRKLMVYKAEKNMKLSVKGTSILGFDIKESKQVMLRKPDEFFAAVNITKRALGIGLKSVPTRPVIPNGRINDECIILGAY